MGTNVNIICLNDTYNFRQFFPPFFSRWIEKLSHRGRLLEHLESSGTKIMMRGPIVRHLCVGKYRETNKDS